MPASLAISHRRLPGAGHQGLETGARMTEQPGRVSDRVGGPACHSYCRRRSFSSRLETSRRRLYRLRFALGTATRFCARRQKASASRTRTNSVINYAPFLPVAAQLLVSLSNCHVLEPLERQIDPVSVSPLIKTRRGRRNNFYRAAWNAVRTRSSDEKAVRLSVRLSNA